MHLVKYFTEFLVIVLTTDLITIKLSKSLYCLAENVTSRLIFQKLDTVNSLYMLHLQQVAPVNPFLQSQVNESIPYSQIPPFWQGLELQSLMIV